MYIKAWSILRDNFLRNLYGLIVYIQSYPLLLISAIYIVSTSVYILVGFSFQVLAFLVGFYMIFVYRYKTLFLPIVIGLLLSSFRFYLKMMEIEEGRQIAKSFLVTDPSRFEGFISKEPRIKENYIEGIIRIKTSEGEPIQALAKLDPYQEYSLGQVCDFEGKIKAPENFNDFDYKVYLEKQGVYLVSEIEKTFCNDVGDKREGNFFLNILYDFKKDLVYRLEKMFHEPDVSLVVGILFGEERYFDSDFEDSLRLSGTTHIIAASGYNVTLLIHSVDRAFSYFLKKKTRIVISIVLIWIFANFSGLSPSIVRACIMSSLILATIYTGNLSSVDFILPLSIFFYTLYDPFIISSLSFQLSVLSIISLMYFSPLLNRLIANISKQKRNNISNFLREYLIPTLACTIFTLPVLVYNFGSASLVGVIANILILPVVESSMLFGLLSLVTPELLLGLKNFFVSIVYTQMNFFEFIVQTFSNWRYSSIEISSTFFTSTWIPIVAYLSLIMLMLVLNKPEDSELNYYLTLYDKLN